MANKQRYQCANCEFIATSLAEARRHAKDAGPIWHTERRTFVSHRLDRITPTS